MTWQSASDSESDGEMAVDVVKPIGLLGGRGAADVAEEGGERRGGKTQQQEDEAEGEEEGEVVEDAVRAVRMWNIAYHTTEQKLRELFEKYGEVSRRREQRETGRPRSA